MGECWQPSDPTHSAQVAYNAANRDYRRRIKFQMKLADEDFYNSLDVKLDPRRFFSSSYPQWYLSINTTTTYQPHHNQWDYIQRLKHSWRPITGMPIHWKSLAFQQSLEITNIRTLIHRRQLNFVHSFSTTPRDSLPRLIFDKRI